ncbi:ABC transporter ATP-binding protein [Streptomyces sp. NPDC019224]|uniref:ABC transporter ATP-binding protein n=1 Tax=Streptomyces sp. NPDC019224 TaxID=3154484 RepID=UPI0033FDE6D6
MGRLAQPGVDWNGLRGPAAVVVGCFLGAQLLAPWQDLAGDHLAKTVDGALFTRLMAASLKLPTVTELERPEVAEQLNAARRELEFGFQSPGRSCAGQAALIGRYVQVVGCAVVLAGLFSWPVAAGLLAVCLLFRHGQRGGLRRYSPVYGETAGDRAHGDYLFSVGTGAPAAKEVKVFGLGGWLGDGYRRITLGWLGHVWRRRRQIYLRPYLAYVLVAVPLAGVCFALLGRRALDGVGLAATVTALQCGLSLLRLGDLYPECDVPMQFGMNALRALERYEALVTSPAVRRTPETGGAPGPETHRTAGERGDLVPPRPQAGRALPDGSHDVRLDAVSFAYPGSAEPVLNGLDLTLRAGLTTALVGVNGAGKSTVVKLLTGLCVPDRGRVTYGGTDIGTVRTDAWRSLVAVVFQDFIHYEASLAENVALGRVAHAGDHPGVESCVRAAGAGRLWDSLPAGGATMLGSHAEEGVELSGGQWQRLAIARALFAVRHGARLLVLDEPTSGLDVQAEAAFHDDVMRALPGVTKLLISHRFATVRHADHIVLIGNGGVVEEGTHEQLMAGGGLYHDMFLTQAAAFAESAGRRA